MQPVHWNMRMMILPFTKLAKALKRPKEEIDTLPKRSHEL